VLCSVQCGLKVNVFGTYSTLDEPFQMKSSGYCKGARHACQYRRIASVLPAEKCTFLSRDASYGAFVYYNVSYLTISNKLSCIIQLQF